MFSISRLRKATSCARSLDLSVSPEITIENWILITSKETNMKKNIISIQESTLTSFIDKSIKPGQNVRVRKPTPNTSHIQEAPVLSLLP